MQGLPRLKRSFDQNQIQFSASKCICNSVYEPEAHYLEGAYCGDSGGETTIENIEVVELQIWNSENEEFIAV